MDLNNKKATRQSYGEALVELGKNNDKVVVLDADLAGATKTNMFSKEFPDRFFDMGIAEQDMIATAAGFATCGKIPFSFFNAEFFIKYSIKKPAVQFSGEFSVKEKERKVTVLNCFFNLFVVNSCEKCQSG